MRLLTITLFLIASIFPAIPAVAQSRAAIDSGFRTFLESEIWPQAKSRGVPRAVFEAAFEGVRPNLDLPDLVLPGETAAVEPQKFQAEFKSPAAYFDEGRVGGLVSRGRAMLAEYGDVLSRIEARYGVPAEIIVAIWGMESAFGAAEIPHNAFEVLGTKAYLSRRKEMFREELLAALQMAADGSVKIADMRSSWAGALGQPQFLPTKFLALAVDFDGDGRKDIWNSVPDTLASIANYLDQAGWISGRDWGFEVNIPLDVSCALEGPDRGQSIRDFIEAGVTRVSGRPFPRDEVGEIGHLMMPAGRFGPGFIATPNFYVIKEYNNSDLYALLVGHAADRMRGGGPLNAHWAASEGLTRGDIADLQRSLVAQGYDVGGVDGLVGFKTRRSIGEWQARAGLPRTCWPTAELADRLD